MAEEGFSYRYSAGDRTREDALRRRYGLPDGTDISPEIKNAPLKERREALHISCILGSVCILAFGGGLSMILAGNAAWTYPAGIVLGSAGLAGMLSMPWVYRTAAERKRRKNGNLFAARMHGSSSGPA